MQLDNVTTWCNTDVLQAWEARSRRAGNRLEGVMIKSFPSEINHVLHDWQIQSLMSCLSGGDSLHVLDIGCGYGRVSQAILRSRSNFHCVGMDLAHNYARQFSKQEASCRAAQAQIPDIPFEDSAYDVVLAVGVLGYMATKPAQRLALKEMLRVLKPGGRCLLITEEPGGRRLWSLGGSLRWLGCIAGRGKGTENMDHVTIKLSNLRNLIEATGGEILSQKGCPILTASLPFLIGMSLTGSKMVASITRSCLALDRALGDRPAPSIYTVSEIVPRR